MSEKKNQRAVFWFRRDLRITDNTGLNAAIQNSEEIIPVYITSDWKKNHHWTGPNRQQFLCESLESLQKNIVALDGSLTFRNGDPFKEIKKLLTETKATALYCNRDYDPFGVKTEQRLQKYCQEIGVSYYSYKDSVIHETDELLTGSNTPYRVYTPYSNLWFKTEHPSSCSKPKKINCPTGIKSEGCPTLKTWNLAPSQADTLKGGEKLARERMQSLLNKNSLLNQYKQARDFPSLQNTSRLSQDLRFGLLSIRELFEKIESLRTSEKSAETKTNLHIFQKELVWREFYFQLIWHFPEVLEHEFNPTWRGLPWEHNQEHLDAWKNGQTGFPIIDAGMRELKSTGFMHNRVRMIVSMFLTKDLHIDWREGEKHFMQELVDGEIASNNGGWQWSAGTGADAAPYFRIQNPWTQTARYDKDGEYIKKWVSELADADPKSFQKQPTKGESVWFGYVPAIVDHSEERNRTLEIFKKHKEQNNLF